MFGQLEGGQALDDARKGLPFRSYGSTRQRVKPAADHGSVYAR